MRIDAVTLKQFRNYVRETARFDPGVTVITGENAQGKTNLLEAVYLLTGGKSFRTRFDRELIAFDAEEAEIEADFFAQERQQRMKITLRRLGRKQIYQNGVKKTASELSGVLTAVLFCPDDLHVVRSGAAARRQLMDACIAQLRPGYRKLLSDFTKLYENKTRILKEWRENSALLDTLDVFSDALCRRSAEIIRYRAAFARLLGERAAPIHAAFSGEREHLSLQYKTVSTVTDCTAPLSEIYAQVAAHQAAHREAELAAGQCLTGAHKDDLEIEINGRSAAKFASQGQTRTAALSIMLAEREIHLLETGEYPILLLDDVLSELDEARQSFVLNRIGEGQTLITCCGDEKQLLSAGGRVLTVQDGHIL